jgi:hypothetical protein
VPLLSPGIEAAPEAGGLQPGSQAFEMKFVVSEALAQDVERWAAKHLEPDAYLDAETGSYQTTTLYLDTPAFDILNRADGYRRRKYRIRRYAQPGPGGEVQLHLERKTRRKDEVRKRRVTIAEHEIHRLAGVDLWANWSGDWFHQKVLKRDLRPACCVTYDRAAFMKLSDTGVLRLTLDRRIRGVPAQDWRLAPVTTGGELLPGQVVCEIKFRDAIPNLFKQLVGDLQLTPGSVSKYRRLMQAAGVPIQTPPAARADGEADNARVAP